MHTGTGADFGTTTGSWSFKWKAPTANNGTATIYAAFNATNKDGTDNGDKIYTQTLQIFGSGPAGIESNSAFQNARIYPNPASDYINLDFPSSVNSVHIYNLKGDEIRNLNYTNFTRLNIQDLAPGIYIVKAASADESITYKFIKQ